MGLLAGLYARTATEDVRSVARQTEAALAAARYDGFVIPDSHDFRFADVGISGLSRARPGFASSVRRRLRWGWRCDSAHGVAPPRSKRCLLRRKRARSL